MSRTFSKLYFLSFVFFLLTSCAAKMISLPVYEGVDLKEELSKMERVRSIDSTFSIEFERDGSVMKGDAVLKLTSETVDLQVYSLGFLVAEVLSNSEITKSDPPLDRLKLSILVDGLKSSFFWWSVRNPDIMDDQERYRISNSWRMLFVDKKTLMPERQTIDLEDGRQLNVFYDEPSLIDGTWFPSKMRIELAHLSVNLKIKTISLKE